VPELRVEIDDGHAVRAAGGASVVHHDVDAAHLVDDPLREQVHRVRVGHVADERERAPVECTDLVGDRLDVAPTSGDLVLGIPVAWPAGTGEHDVAPGTRELDRDGPADRAHPARAGDDRDLAVEAGEREAGHGHIAFE
jgi:hypothetical protein